MSVTQQAFHSALLTPESEIPEGLTDGHGQPAGRRFAVYRNNVAASLTDALEVSFPAIVKLIGPENFRRMAGIFLRQHPPSTPILSKYGAQMPAFLTGFAPLQHLGYLPDVARLEQAIRLSYHAADAAAVDPAILQTLPPEKLNDVRFTLVPSLQLVSSAWPIHAIWAFNLEDGPKPEAGAENVLILRPEFDPDLTSISAGAAEFIQRIQLGSTLGTANTAASEADPNFDLSHALGLLLTGQAITKIHLEPLE